MTEPAAERICPEECLVLVVDDEPSMREACSDVLRREGFQVVTAGDGAQGLRLAHDQRPDIIFMDLKMPGLPGLELLDQFAADAPATVKVVITAYATVSAAMAALRHGAFDFLAKPFTPDELRLIAGRAMEQRRLLVRGQRLQQERDQAKRRFMELVTGEVREPVLAALAEMNALAERLTDRPEALALAQRAADRLRRLLEMVQRLGV